MKHILIAATATLLTAVGSIGGVTAANAATYPVETKATWVNDTLSVTFTAVNTPGTGVDEVMEVNVDGKSVYQPLEIRLHEVRTFQITRTAADNPANVEVIGHNCGDNGCTSTTLYSAKVTRQVVTPKRGQVSAATLLVELTVATSTQGSSYTSAKFGSWVDANHDGENTRTEVLKAESSTKATVKHGTVTRGAWTSPYDGKTYISPFALDIDHLVPLKEAWTSGAYKWSAKQRAAYANDLSYGPSLVAVSKQERRTKGDQDPTAYLPPKASNRCSYVRDYIAVKYRWNLAVDPAEKAALQNDLAIWCVNPYVTTPVTPNVKTLLP